MPYELFISLRYLRAKRKEAFISLITGFSLFGVTIGVMTLNIVLSVMSGFEEELRERIMGFNPHVLVLSNLGPVADYPDVMERLDRIAGVKKTAPAVYGQAMLSFEENVTGVLVRGVLPVEGANADLQKYLQSGRVEQLGVDHPVVLNEGKGSAVKLPGLMLGTELSRQLRAGLGDVVTMVSPLGRPTAVGMVPRIKRFVIIGLFKSGMSEYDSGLAYIGLVEAQKFFSLADMVTALEVETEDMDEAREVGRRIAAELGFGYRVRDWMEVNGAIFSALELEKRVYFLVLLLIILVSAFNIVATLIMVVMEKRKDIAVLKSMGATASAIGRIFVFKGVVIGAMGTALGDVLGYAACRLLQRYKIITLDPQVWPTDTLPVKIAPEFFLVVSAASLLICLLATIYPARQAARLVPVDIIRYE